jgi:hypothetical protein
MTRTRLAFAKLTILFYIAATDSWCAVARQTVPDFKRQIQIKASMIAHGYKIGRTWPETVVILKQIARDHHWQSRHAPDARVLILLGLGNKYSNPDVLYEPPSRLEIPQ